MKAQIRVVGFDDGPFRFDETWVPIVGVVMRAGYIDAVMTTRARVDGRDATTAIAKAVNGSKYREQLRAILLDGIAVGGFNVIDMEALSSTTGLPVISVTRHRPDPVAIERVLETRFKDHARRWEIVSRGSLVEVRTAHNPIHCRFVGIDEGRGRDILRVSTVRGAIPEPLRVAHLMAAAVVKGESRGDA